MTRTLDVAALVAGARRGDPRSVGRMISIVEDGSPQLRALMAALAAGGTPGPARGSRAHVIGLTGSPGVGKSTTTSALVRAYREAGARVGVLAVDPS